MNVESFYFKTGFIDRLGILMIIKELSPVIIKM